MFLWGVLGVCTDKWLNFGFLGGIVGRSERRDRKLEVRVPQGLLDAIDARVGSRHRSEFARAALESAVRLLDFRSVPSPVVAVGVIDGGVGGSDPVPAGVPVSVSPDPVFGFVSGRGGRALLRDIADGLGWIERRVERAVMKDGRLRLVQGVVEALK